MFGFLRGIFASGPSPSQTDDIFAAADFRYELDHILQTHRLSVDPNSPDKLLSEIVAVAVFITEKALELAGRDVTQFTVSEATAATVVTVVAADHLSRLAEKPFEVTGLGAGYALWGHFGPENAAEIVHDAASNFNRLSLSSADHGIVSVTGAAIAKFFTSGDVRHLEAIKAPLTLLIERVRPS